VREEERVRERTYNSLEVLSLADDLGGFDHVSSCEEAKQNFE
jgi:hypothetical protein